MKTKVILICLLSGIIFMACEESFSRIGLSIQPDEDKVSVFDTIVMATARTILVDSVYAKTTNGLLGEIYDPSYGNIKSSYICQYYPARGFPYLDSIVDNKIDAVFLNITYNSIFGDTLAPMEVSVYPIVKPLESNYYTNADPTAYCDMNRPLGKYGFTARNFHLSDEDLSESNYVYYIQIPLPVQLGQDYLDKIINNELKTLEEFLEFFPGTYITTTFGTGCMLNVLTTDISIDYTRFTTLKDVDGKDSIATRSSSAIFSVTKEIIQLNQFENINPDFLTEDNPDKTYIKSPAGVFTEITIPIKDIVKGIGKKKFSSVKLSLKAYPVDDWKYSIQIPGSPLSRVPLSDNSSGFSAKMLLIEPDSLKSFFETKKVADKQTSYTTFFDVATFTYNFNNISNVVQNAIDKAPDKDLVLWLIPVLTTWFSQGSSYYAPTKIDYMTSHYLYPSGVTLKKGGDNLKISVIATDLTIND